MSKFLTIVAIIMLFAPATAMAQHCNGGWKKDGSFLIFQFYKCESHSTSGPYAPRYERVYTEEYNPRTKKMERVYLHNGKKYR